MENKSLDAFISASLHPHVITRLNISRLLIFIILFVVGLIVFLSAFGIYQEMPAMGFIIGGLGIFLSGVAISCIVKRTKEMVYLPTGSIARKQSLFFDLKYVEQLRGFVSSGQFSEFRLCEQDAQGNVRLDILESGDHKFVALQLYRFVPYTYNPVTDVYCYTGQEAAKVCSFISEE